MAASFFESLFTNLERTEFGSELRKFTDEIASLLKDLPTSSSPRTTERPNAQDKARQELKSWTMDDFRSSLHEASRQGRQFSSLPDSIDLSGFGRVLTRLREQAQDGFEYGRIAYMRNYDGKFEMGETCRGNRDRVEIQRKISPFMIPAVMMHTHPSMGGSTLSPCHFSPQDFQTFLDISAMRASIVLAPRASLMMVKTSRMPDPEKIPDTWFDSVYDRVGRDFTVPHQSKQARATQIICSTLGLELYLRKEDAPNFVFEQVKLKGER